MANKNLKNDRNRRMHIQAVKHDHSVDGSARKVSQAKHTASDPPANLAEAIRARFAPLGGVELELPPREPMREPPDFE